MAVYYLDSSALFKRYRREAGSAWITTLCQTELIVSSALLLVEIHSTLARLTREGAITQADRDLLTVRFIQDTQVFDLVEIDRAVVHRASRLIIECPPATPLRSLDALHLASAVLLRDRLSQGQAGQSLASFVSSDRRLLAAAEWAGLPVENPEDHA
jgi:uncharacterized protein